MKASTAILVATLGLLPSFGIAADPLYSPYTQPPGAISDTELNPWRTPAILKEVDIQLEGLDTAVKSWAKSPDSRAYAQAVVSITARLVAALRALQDIHTESKPQNDAAMLIAHVTAFTERVLQISQLEFRIDTLPKDVADTIVQGVTKADFETVLRGASYYLVAKMSSEQAAEKKGQLLKLAADSIRKFGSEWSSLSDCHYLGGELLGETVLGKRSDYIFSDRYGVPSAPGTGKPKKIVRRQAITILPKGENGPLLMKKLDGSIIEVLKGMDVTMEKDIEHGDISTICILPDGTQVKTHYRNIEWKQPEWKSVESK